MAARDVEFSLIAELQNSRGGVELVEFIEWWGGIVCSFCSASMLRSRAKASVESGGEEGRE